METLVKKKLTEEEMAYIIAFIELPEDVRKQLLSYGAGMLAMRKAG